MEAVNLARFIESCSAVHDVSENRLEGFDRVHEGTVHALCEHTTQELLTSIGFASSTAVSADNGILSIIERYSALVKELVLSEEACTARSDAFGTAMIGARNAAGPALRLLRRLDAIHRDERRESELSLDSLVIQHLYQKLSTSRVSSSSRSKSSSSNNNSNNDNRAELTAVLVLLLVRTTPQSDTDATKSLDDQGEREKYNCCGDDDEAEKLAQALASLLRAICRDIQTLVPPFIGTDIGADPDVIPSPRNVWLCTQLHKARVLHLMCSTMSLSSVGH